MKLSNFFKEDHVLVHSEGDSLADVIDALLASLGESLGADDPPQLSERILHEIHKRPRVVGEGVLMARLRSEVIGQFQVALAVLENPVTLGGADLPPIRMVFLVLAPPNQNTLMLQTIAAISRLVGSKASSEAFKGVRSATRLIRLIEESGLEVKNNIRAVDIMEPIEFTLQIDTPLEEAVEALAAASYEGLPVLDEKGRLVGEITTREILHFGMPTYMDLLTNPEMLNAFEPFENYFVNASKATVRDVCRRNFGAVAPSAPIVRVAHMMITENRRRVYVLDDEKIEGVIYRKSILLRVMCQ